jgi:hypothetical protein
MEVEKDVEKRSKKKRSEAGRRKGSGGGCGIKGYKGDDRGKRKRRWRKIWNK